MKKNIFVLAVFFLALTATQSQVIMPVKEKAYYSFLWGTFKSKNYSNHKNKNVDFTASLKSKDSKAIIDTTQYVKKRVLWGIIAWTENKKNIKVKKNE